MPSLIHLSLYYNELSFEFSSFILNCQNLTFLDLSLNKLSGPIPELVFTNLGKLEYFNVSYNQFQGQLSSNVSRLSNLIELRLVMNNFSGPIPEEIGLMSNLQVIEVYNSSFGGQIPSSLGQLKNLQSLDLRMNTLNSTIPPELGNCTNLTYLALAVNQLREQLPLSLSNLVKLSDLGLSDNALSGEISGNLIANWTELVSLQLQNNFFTGNIPPEIGLLSKLSYLYLFKPNFSGLIPWTNLEYRDLHSNLLQRSLLVLPPLMRALSVSDNRFTREIPLSFCNLSSIEYLDLSNNSFTGTIPQCLGDSNMLLVLLLQKNNFHGNIPQFFANNCSLTSLNLSGNQLEGPLPPSLGNCKSLQILDVGKNRINDTFPPWLAYLPELQVLILHSNKFHGPIGNSSTRSPFPKLRVLDLSRNKFNGVLPMRYFQNFKAMMDEDYDSAHEQYMRQSFHGEYYSVSLTVKGIDIEMERILTIFTTIDLSSNKFQGEILEVVGKLHLLKGLNFSHNNLTGYIPLSLGNLTVLESLDLSWNKLFGKIPMQLANLKYLAVLNLSYNQFDGLIPQGAQFNTFLNDSYTGNLRLWGFPLPEKCRNGDELPKPRPIIFHEEEEDVSSWFDWKVAKIGYGSGLVIGLSVGYMILTTGRPQWFVRIMERKQPKKVRRLSRGRLRIAR